MNSNIRNLFAFLVTCIFLAGLKSTTPLTIQTGYKNYFHVSEDLKEEEKTCLLPQEKADDLNKYLTKCGITADWFSRLARFICDTSNFNSDDRAKARKAICKRFTDAGFDMYKGKKEDAQTIVAAFPADSGFQEYVFKASLSENLSEYKNNIIRVVWAQAINKRLKERGIFPQINAPEKFIFKLPGGRDEFNDRNYAALCQKIAITKVKGNVFDVINSSDLDKLIGEIVLYFGMCDLHPSYGAEDTGQRNVIYACDINDKRKHTINLIDTDPDAYKKSRTDYRNLADIEQLNFFFDMRKKVASLEFFISQYLCHSKSYEKTSTIYKLGLDLAYWFYILNRGIIEPYEYYNFDSLDPLWNPPQPDTKADLPFEKFDFSQFEKHRNVFKKYAYICVININECLNAIKKLKPNIQKDVEQYFNMQEKTFVYPFGKQMFINASANEGVQIKETDGNYANGYVVVPIEKYLFFRTAAKSLENVHSIKPGIKFEDLQKKFGTSFSPIKEEEVKKPEEKNIKKKKEARLIQPKKPSAQHFRTSP